MEIYKDEHHHHYWVENGILFETYGTIRGLRYRSLLKVDYPDKDKLSEADFAIIKASPLTTQLD